jgi:hypothetical protein
MKVCAVEREIQQPPYARKIVFRHEGPLAASPVNVN